MSEIKRYNCEISYIPLVSEHVADMVSCEDGDWVRYEDVLPFFAERVCPCILASEPCRPVCSCVEWVSSYGCKCCTRYGSEEQRKQRAEHIVHAVTAFDDERDTTPVDAEWLDRVMERDPKSIRSCWVDGACRVVTLEDSNFAIYFAGLFRMENPTRGDVLTALRLFKGRI